MNQGDFLLSALVYLGAAVVAVPLAKRVGLGSVLGYLIAGITIGPFGLHLVGEEGQDLLHFAEFGVVLMLFLIGLELEPTSVWRMRGPILGLGGSQVVITSALFAIALHWMGLPWNAAVALGMTVSLSSTALVLQTLNEKGLMRTAGGRSAFAVLLFQDIAVIPMLAVMPLLATGASAAAGAADHGPDAKWIDTLPAWASAVVVLGAMSAIVLAGRFLLRPAFRFIARSGLPEMFTAAALLLVIGIAELMTLVGLSPALGTFVAGVVLAGSEYRHQLEGDIQPFKGLLLGLFFIAVGSSIDFALIGEEFGVISGLVALLIVTKLFLLLGLGRLFKLGTDQNLLMSFSLAQGGEFAFVLTSFALQSGVVTDDLAARTIAVVALSLALTPIVMLLNERFLMPRVGTREKAPGLSEDIHQANPVIIAGFGNFGQVVGRLLLANGVDATLLDVDSERVELLRNLGFQVYYGDATREDLLRNAGAEEAKLLVVAIDSSAKALELVRCAKRHFPHLELLVRATSREAAYQLIEEGVEHVYRHTLDTALVAGKDTLRMLGHRAYQVERSAHTFRRHDEAAIRELARLRHDRQQYVTLARKRIRDLEQILRSDREDSALWSDFGWDVDSLKTEVVETGEVEAKKETAPVDASEAAAAAGDAGERRPEAEGSLDPEGGEGPQPS